MLYYALLALIALMRGHVAAEHVRLIIARLRRCPKGRDSAELGGEPAG